MEGTVKWFNRNKGYGFVAGEDGKEYFVHQSELAEGTFIRDDDSVSFEPGEGDRGPIAKNVTLVQKASEKSEEPKQSEGSEEPEQSEGSEEPEEEAA